MGAAGVTLSGCIDIGLELHERWNRLAMESGYHNDKDFAHFLMDRYESPFGSVLQDQWWVPSHLKKQFNVATNSIDIPKPTKRGIDAHNQVNICGHHQNIQIKARRKNPPKPRVKQP